MTDREIEATQSGFTPIFDVIARDPELGTIAAVVFGEVWRRCRLRRGQCDASRKTMADETGLSKKTFDRWLPELCKRGYLVDLTPEAKHRPHVYRDAGKIRMQVKVEVEVEMDGETESPTSDEQGRTLRPTSKARGRTESPTSTPTGETQSPTRWDLESHKEIKDQDHDEDEGDLLIALTDLTGLSRENAGVIVEKYGVMDAARWLVFVLERADDPAAYLASCCIAKSDPPPVQYTEQEIEQALQRARNLRDRSRPEGDVESSGVDPPGDLPASLPLPGTGMDAREVWTRVLEELRMQMTRSTFDTWLRGSQVADVAADVLTVQVRDQYAIDWLQGRWRAPIERTLAGIVGEASVKVAFVCGDGQDGPAERAAESVLCAA